jgi:hypothetical protein
VMPGVISHHLNVPSRILKRNFRPVLHRLIHDVINVAVPRNRWARGEGVLGIVDPHVLKGHGGVELL